MTDVDDGTAAALHLFSPEVARAPHAAYRQLREQCPVAKADLGGHDVVLISRYEDVLFALRHPEYCPRSVSLLAQMLRRRRHRSRWGVSRRGARAFGGRGGLARLGSR